MLEGGVSSSCFVPQRNPADPTWNAVAAPTMSYLECAAHSSPNMPCVLSGEEERELNPSSSQEAAEAEGFGKLYPSAQPTQQQEERSDDEQDLTSDVISRKELEKGRLSRDGKRQHGGSAAGKVQAAAVIAVWFFFFPSFFCRFTKTWVSVTGKWGGKIKKNRLQFSKLSG